MEFTTETIAALSLPAGKSDLIQFDSELPGFGIRLRAGGKRVWIVQYRVAGRQRRETLGDARRIVLKAARDAARKRFAQVALGGDPQADKADAKARAANTLGPLFDRYLAVTKSAHRANTHIANTRYLGNYFRPWRSLPVDNLTRKQVAVRLSEIVSENGVTAAARARQCLSAFYSWAMREGVAEANPVIGTNNPGAQMRPRDRVLTSDELRAVWAGCLDDDFGRILRLLMLTGARRDEIGGLRWSEVDLDKAILEIPGNRTKNHHPLRLILPATAMTILQGIPRKPDRAFIFGGGAGPYSPWAWAKLTIDARIAQNEQRPLAPWRIHDVRRTVATGMAELGVQPHIVETILNHRGGHKGGVAGIYNKATYEAETKRALALWADHLLSIVEGTTRKIIPLAPAAA